METSSIFQKPDHRPVALTLHSLTPTVKKSGKQLHQRTLKSWKLDAEDQDALEDFHKALRADLAQISPLNVEKLTGIIVSAAKRCQSKATVCKRQESPEVTTLRFRRRGAADKMERLNISKQLLRVLARERKQRRTDKLERVILRGGGKREACGTSRFSSWYGLCRSHTHC